MSHRSRFEDSFPLLKFIKDPKEPWLILFYYIHMCVCLSVYTHTEAVLGLSSSTQDLFAAAREI